MCETVQYVNNKLYTMTCKVIPKPKQRATSDEVVSVEPCPKATGAKPWTKATEAEPRTKVTCEAD